MQVESFLELSAHRYPDKTALVYDGRRWSYRAIEAEANRIAHALIAIGVERGDRVAVCLDNSAAAVCWIFAILKAGAIFVLVNPATRQERLTHILANAEARVLAAKADKVSCIQSCWESLPCLERVVIAGNPHSLTEVPERFILQDHLTAEYRVCIEPPPRRCSDADIAALIYTSGSTGLPKGVIMRHQNMVAAATSVMSYLENSAEDIIANVLPLSSSYGLYQVLMGFKAGATVVLERSLTYPHAVLQNLIHERVTGFAIVPTIAALLLQLDLSDYRFSDMRYITNAGAALPASHIPHLRKIFPSAQLYLMYGLAECKRVSYLPPDQLERRPTSVGKPMPNVEVYIVNDEGRPVPAGEVGELVVRGPNVMQGYWKLPAETDAALRPGPVSGERVLYTGDLFRMDEEGYLYWIGRRDDIIKSRGEKVSPREVENVLYRLPGIAMAAVVGVPDPVLGEAVKAVIVLKEGVRLTANEVLIHCARYLEDFMIPKVVEFRSALPKTDAGKIDKRELVERGES